MLNPGDFAKLIPNAREELIKKFNLVRSGFGSDVRGNEVFMFDGFTKLDLINVTNDTRENTQQNGSGIDEGTRSKKTKGVRKGKSISIPASK